MSSKSDIRVEKQTMQPPDKHPIKHHPSLVKGKLKRWSTTGPTHRNRIFKLDTACIPTLTWKNASCFSRLQKNGCFNTAAAHGRNSGLKLIIDSTNSRHTTFSAEKIKLHFCLCVCMHICVNMCAYVCVFMHLSVPVCLSVSLRGQCVYVCMHIIYIWMCVHVQTCVQAWMPVCVCVRMCRGVCKPAFVCVCVCCTHVWLHACLLARVLPQVLTNFSQMIRTLGCNAFCKTYHLPVGAPDKNLQPRYWTAAWANHHTDAFPSSQHNTRCSQLRRCPLHRSESQTNYCFNPTWT